MVSPPIDGVVLPTMDVSLRLGRLRAVMADAGCEALVVTSRTNIRYLTGFTGSAGLLLVTPDGNVLLTDGRYTTQAAEQVAASGAQVTIEIGSGPGQRELATGLVGGTALRLGLEAAHVSWAAQRTYAADWFPAASLVPTVGLVESLRRAKDPGELARMALAAQIADEALAAVRPLLADEPTEADFGRGLDDMMRRLGASGPSFETIVASGPNGAKPHHRPSTRRIQPGEPVVIDFGAVVDGYCSDMTRTVWIGELSDPELRRAVEVVTISQAAGVAAVGSGVACADIDGACRAVITEAGWAERFVHGTGHGVGLDIHEAPSVAASSTDTLLVGHVVTVEPGVYLPGRGGVRVEDTVVVTDEGCYPLTSTPKDVCASDSRARPSIA